MAINSSMVGVQIFMSVLLLGSFFSNADGQNSASSMIGFSGARVTTSSDNRPPVKWNEKLNLKYRFKLPGPGSSSPIVVGEKLFVTCFTGYGLNPKRPGEISKLRRLLICINKNTGREIWRKQFSNGEKEDPLNQQIADHGYASSTPISDGKKLFAFFGKAGVFAFDLDGKQLWNSSLGSDSSQFRQGSGASPLLFNNLLIVNAADEANAIIALDKSDGREVWRNESKSLDGSYVTPIAAETSNEKQIVVSMINQAWGLNPKNGKQIWKLKTSQDGSVVPTPISASESMLMLFGGMGGTTYCMNPNTTGNVSKKHIHWTSRHGSIVSTPLLYNGHLYWADMQGIAYCLEASNGELVYRERLGKQAGCYASPVLADGKIYFTSRKQGVFVVPAEPRFEILAHNKIESDSSRCDGTPAIDGGCIFLRTNKAIYCFEAS